MTIIVASSIYLYNTTISCETVKAEMSAHSKKVAGLKIILFVSAKICKRQQYY